MLHEVTIIYKDGRETTEIVCTKPGEQLTIYPQRDGIVFCHKRTFKYKVPKHPRLPLCIVHFAASNRFVISPYDIECAPGTKYTDLEIIDDTPKVEKPKKEKPKTWQFESSSGDGFYEVRMTPYGLKCNCFGAIRSKQNCKHIKQVRAEL
jgi:hypothetical protein